MYSSLISELSVELLCGALVSETRPKTLVPSTETAKIFDCSGHCCISAAVMEQRRVKQGLSRILFPYRVH